MQIAAANKVNAKSLAEKEITEKKTPQNKIELLEHFRNAAGFRQIGLDCFNRHCTIPKWQLTPDKAKKNSTEFYAAFEPCALEMQNQAPKAINDPASEFRKCFRGRVDMDLGKRVTALRTEIKALANEDCLPKIEKLYILQKVNSDTALNLLVDKLIANCPELIRSKRSIEKN